MKPTIKIFPETKFIGKNLSFTYTDYRAFELWSSFMPRRNESFIHIFLEKCIDKINCLEISQQDVDEMD